MGAGDNMVESRRRKSKMVSKNKMVSSSKWRILLAVVTAMLLVASFGGGWGITTASEERRLDMGNLGKPFRYPAFPQKGVTPDYLLMDEPAVAMDGKYAVINFETVKPVPGAKVYFGLYVPDQEIKVPQYRREAIEGLTGEGTEHTVKLKISKFEDPAYDLGNFAEKGGVICYRIELYNSDKAASVFYDGRFRVDGEYNIVPCVTEGPFVDMVTTTSAVISWDASDETDGAVLIDDHLYTDGIVSTHHEIAVEDLTPNTKYDYDVFVDGVKDFRGYHFKTAPIDGKFNFAVMSDSREGVGGGERSFGGVNYQKLSYLMQDAYNNGADFILFGGDLVNGYTTNATDFRMQLRAWEDAAEQVGCYIPIYEGMGNHEALMDAYDDGSWYGIEFDKPDDGTSKSAECVFAEEFVNPTHGPDPEDSTAPTYRENVYYFDWGNTRMISFNTNYWWCNYPEDFGGNLEGYVMDNQLEWIKKVLDDAANNPLIEHIFMFAHEPAFPNGGHLGDAQWYRGGDPAKNKDHDGNPLDRTYVVDRRDELWGAISQNGKVVGVFFGDEHNYHRTLINEDTPVYLDGTSNPDFTNPVWHIVTGGAGAPFYAQQETPWTDWVESFYPCRHYCMIYVDGANITLKVTNDSGEIVDDCVLTPFPHEIDANPGQTHLSWSTNDVYHTMTAMWFTQSLAGNRVLYDTVSRGSSDDYAFVCDGARHRVGDFAGWYHEAQLAGLEPGTTYYFRVGGPRGYSREWSFRTIGLDQKVMFAVAGDSRRPWGDGYEIKVSPTCISNWPHARDWVTSCVTEEDPDFVIFTGDMVGEGNDQVHWNNWFESMQDHLVTENGRMIPIVAVIGNHEMGGHPDVDSTYDWFKGVFANPGNELWYSLDFPGLHVTTLSATGGCVGTWWKYAVPEAQSQRDWLEADLAGSDAEWKVVVWHVPYYSGFVTGTGDTEEVFLRDWSPIVERPKYGVDLVMNGHVHNYMRSWPLRTWIEEVPVDAEWTDVGYRARYELAGNSSEGVTYITQGCWGAPTDPYVKGGDCDIRDFMAAAAARPSYTLVELTDDGIHLLTKDTLGDVLDDATLPYTTADFVVPEYEYVI